MDLITYALCKGNGGGGGGSSNVLVTTITWGETEGVLDKTWQEIYDADFCIAKDEYGMFYYIVTVAGDSGTYGVVFASPAIGASTITFDKIEFITNSASGYPVNQY